MLLPPERIVSLPDESPQGSIGGIMGVLVKAVLFLVCPYSEGTALQES